MFYLLSLRDGGLKVCSSTVSLTCRVVSGGSEFVSNSSDMMDSMSSCVFCPLVCIFLKSGFIFDVWFDWVLASSMVTSSSKAFGVIAPLRVSSSFLFVSIMLGKVLGSGFFTLSSF